jgi:hypothetical protein
MDHSYNVGKNSLTRLGKVKSGIDGLEAEQQFTVRLIYQLFLDFCMVNNVLQMYIAKKLPLL